MRKTFKIHIESKGIKSTWWSKMVELNNSEEKSFKCLISEKVFCWHTILTKYTVMHTGDNPFQYILCEKAFEFFFN